MQKIASICSVLILTATVCLFAQPSPPAVSEVPSQPPSGRAFVERGGLTAAQCNPIPTLDQVKTGPWYYEDRLRTASEAISLGIPVANISGSHNLMIFVRDYRRATQCTATDGKTEMLYGQVARAVIEIDNYDVKLGSSLAAIAAAGTLQRKNQQFYLFKDGFYNPAIDKIIGTVSGKAFDVENYAAYQTVIARMIELLSDKDTQLAVNKIGVIPSQDDPRFLDASIIAYSFDQIVRGKACTTAKTKFATNAADAATVEQAYRFVTGACDSTVPSADAQRRAKELGKGIVIK